MTYEMRDVRCHTCGVEFQMKVPAGTFYEVHCPACIEKAKAGEEFESDGVRVAQMFVSEVELTNLIEATSITSLCVMGDDRRALFNRVAEDLKKLRKEAFGR